MSVLLLVHGLGATGRVWDGWRELLDEHWPGHWLAPDLPGHGAADPLTTYTFDSMAAALAQRLDADEPLEVLGHSLGGVIGITLASGRFGVQVETVVGLGIKVEWSPEELAKAAALGARPVAWYDSRAEAAARYLRVSGLHGLVDPEDSTVDAGIRAEDGRWRLAMDPASFGVGAPDMPALLAASRARVTLARGEHDPMNTDAQLSALHPHVVTVPDLGHNAHVEDPAAVLRLVAPARPSE
jgi:pimeloyl-ACP methyl ester carboxylesterase